MFVIPVSRESRQIARLFDDTFERVLGPLSSAEPHAARSPALDVAETEVAYTVTLDMPGVAKDDIKVAVEGRQIRVHARSKPSAEKTETGVVTDRIVYRERALSSYARTFNLPVEVDQSEAQAKLEQGVLTLTLPKRGARSAAQITVN